MLAPEPEVVVPPVATVVALAAAVGTVIVPGAFAEYVVCVLSVAAPIIKLPLLTLTPFNQSVFVVLAAPAPVAVV